MCHPGILAKFEQNPMILDTLIHKTGYKQIVECASDHLWGTGFSLGNPDCLDSSKWISQGILGQILEDICTAFQQTDRLCPHNPLSSVSMSHLSHVLCTTATPSNATCPMESLSACPYPDVQATEPGTTDGKNNKPLGHLSPCAAAEEAPAPAVGKPNVDHAETSDDRQSKDMEIT